MKREREARLVVRGGKKLLGDVTVHGAKNAVLPMLAAGMLLFAGIGRLMIFINEKSVARSFALPEYVREAKVCGNGAAAPGGRI